MLPMSSVVVAAGDLLVDGLVRVEVVADLVDVAEFDRLADDAARRRRAFPGP